jgi:CRISPR-associated protein Cas5t
MKKLWLRLQAPFAAFRYFQAGVYRATSPVIPHSAAWGLVLNLAGIDIRINENNAITEIDPSAPKLLIAVGSVSNGERNTLYQQLHSYPVGNSGKEFAERTKGTKYWIAPVKREILAGFDAMIGVQTDDGQLIENIKLGLTGELDVIRYGLPFAGDNNLLFDQIKVVASPEPAYWYTPVEQNDSPRKDSCRLSIKIDRVDSSKSRALLFAPEIAQSEIPPESAWIWTPEASAA